MCTITDALKRAREIEAAATLAPCIPVEFITHACETHKLLLDIAEASSALGCTCGVAGGDRRPHVSWCEKNIAALQAFADYMGKAE